MTGRLTPAEQLAALEATVGQKGKPASLLDSDLDPTMPAPRRCISCQGSGTQPVWGLAGATGMRPCEFCDGTGNRADITVCDECEEPLTDDDTDALCEACKQLPRCRDCGLRLRDPDAMPGDRCDDCLRDFNRYDELLGDL